MPRTPPASSPLRARIGQRATLAVLWLLGRLPPRATLALGEMIGRGARLLLRQRRRIAARNLELCFPELTAAERERLLCENFRYLGRALAETALAWYGGPAVDRLPCTVHGLEHLRGAQADGRAVILLSGHFQCVEMAARLIGPRVHMAVIYKPMRKKPLLDRAMLGSRRTALAGALPREDIRGIVRTLKAGTPVWYAGDQDYGRRQSVFAPFFGVPAATVTGLTRLARMSGARVVPLFFNVAAGGRGYEITFRPALEGFPTGDTERDAARMNAAIEEAVRHNPAQYLWVHRRFKRRPSGDEPVYDDTLQRPRSRLRREAR